LPQNRDEAGFTLIELLVVLVLMAGIAALVLPRFTAGRAETLERRAAAVAADLARLRQEAIGAGEIRRVSDAALSAVLPAGMVLAASEPGEIVFFPNGMANGAVWRLEAEGRAVTLDVDWLTGRVALEGR
jgi:general secretion pathway protein H